MYYYMVLLMMVPGALAAWTKNFMKLYQLLPKICYIALSPFVIKQFWNCNFMFPFVNALWTAVIIGGDVGALLCIVKVASGLVLSVSLYHSISLVCTVVLLVVFWIELKRNNVDSLQQSITFLLFAKIVFYTDLANDDDCIEMSCYKS